MDIFGENGQAEAMPLSDEALYGIEERQGEEPQPQEEPNNGDTGSNGEVEEPAEPAGTPAPEGQTDPQAAEIERLRKSYEELRQWTTRVAVESSRLKKQLAEQQASAQNQPKAQTEEDKKTLLRSFLNDPDAFVNQMVERRVNEALRPVLQERERASINKAVGDAIEDVSTGWTQAKEPQGRQELVRRMFEIASRNGDASAWTKDPMKYAVAACRDLWGWPSHANQAAVEAAKRAAVQEYQEQRQNKEGLAANPPANRQSIPKEMTPEEKILEAMRNAGGDGLF